MMVNRLLPTGTGRAAFLTRLVVFAERAEPRSLRGWWFLRNGQSHVPYRVRYGRTTVRNTLRVFRVNKPTHTITYNGNRIAPKRNGQSHVPYRVRYGRTIVRNIPLGVPRKQTHPYNELRRQTNRSQTERAEPRSLRGWWFLRNGQSHVPYSCYFIVFC